MCEGRQGVEFMRGSRGGRRWVPNAVGAGLLAAAALGVFTPMPCIPVTAAPWAPGAVGLTINNMPALNVTSKCI